MQEYGFDDAVINMAVKTCESNIQASIEFCLAFAEHGQTSTPADVSVNFDVRTLCAMGFDEKQCIKALTQTKSNLPVALEFLLCGHPTFDELDNSSNVNTVGYAERAQLVAPRRSPYIVRDLGARAGPRTNACLWLSMIDGWSQLNNNAEYVQHDTVLADIIKYLPKVAATPHNKLVREGRHHNDAVGLLADRLRQHFCAANGVMYTPSMIQLCLPAYAALCTRDGSRATIAKYKNWLATVATNDLADELVLLAIALHLRVWITAIPSRENWAVSEYPHHEKRRELNIGEDRRIVLGNDNLHYVHVL